MNERIDFLDKKVSRKKKLSIASGVIYGVTVLLIPFWAGDRNRQIDTGILCSVIAFFLYGWSALRWYVEYSSINPNASYIDWFFIHTVENKPMLSICAVNAYKWLLLMVLTFIGAIIRMALDL